MKLCIVLLSPPKLSETFLVEHVENLAEDVTALHHSELAGAIWEPVRPGLTGLLRRAARKLGVDGGRGGPARCTELYLEAFRETRPDVVLAEYGPAGVVVMQACHRAGVPLVVHFHGSDASRRNTLRWHRSSYRWLFERAAAVVTVSRDMERRLVELGAPAEKVHYNPMGVDCARFVGADPGSAEPVFVGVGRLVEKKAPDRSIEAFAEVQKQVPEARLRLIGDGPLLAHCRRLVRQLGLEAAVTLLGAQPHDRVRAEMQSARAFVQHSVVAEDGNSEGTPVAVMEAGASGLPVVATRHAGIPDVILDGETGLLVPERDTRAMAACMTRLALDPALAERLGRAARARIRSRFSRERSHEKLREILRGCASADRAPREGGFPAR